MKSLMDLFKSKYKINVKEKAYKPAEEQEKEASRMTLELKAVFTTIPLLKPHNGNYNFVKLEQAQIDIILNVLNTNNKLIKQNNFFIEIKDFLEKLVNADAIELDKEFYINARSAEKLCYSLQGQEYWEDREI